MITQKLRTIDEILAEIAVSGQIGEIVSRSPHIHSATKGTCILTVRTNYIQSLGMYSSIIIFPYLASLDSVSLDDLEERIVETVGGGIKIAAFTQLIREFPIRVGFLNQRGDHDFTCSFQNGADYTTKKISCATNRKQKGE